MFIYTVLFFMGLAFLTFECARHLPKEFFDKMSLEIWEIEEIVLKNPVAAIAVIFAVMTIVLVIIGYVIKFDLVQLFLFISTLCVTLFVLKGLLDNLTDLKEEYVNFFAVLIVTFLAVSYALTPTWFVVNILTIAMAAFAIRLFSAIPLKLLFLILVTTFIYDVVHVYVTGYMVSTATAIVSSEIPGPIFRSPASFANLRLEANFGSILGAGDVIIPGVLVMKGIQLGLKSQMLLAYMLGLVAAFVIFYTTKMPVPALVTLVPITFATLWALSKRRNIELA